MIRTTITGGMVLAVLIAGNLSAQDKTGSSGDRQKIDAAAIAGGWKIEKGMRAGEASGADRLGTVDIGKTEITMPSGTDEDFVIAYTMDSSHNPAHIDLTITGGPAPESEAKGIIALKGGKLMLCYNPFGGDRPTAFESTAENGNYLFVMSRQSGNIDPEKLAGTWQYASGVRAGAETPADRLVGDVVITDKTFTIPGGPEGNFVMAYKLDTDQSPATIDLEIQEGPVPEGKALGIIRMDGEKIVLCYNPAGDTRPGDFESTEENGFFLFVLKPAGDR